MEYIVRFINLPTTIKSFVRLNHDGTATIIINSKLNRETQLLCYRHETSHINEQDFERINADIVEKERHQ